MEAGRLRYSVTLQRQATTKNSRGEYAQTYTTIASRRAAIRPLAGREYFQASGEHSDVTTEIRVRYDSTLKSLKPADRVLDATHSPQVVYDILSVIRPRETALELILMCVRRNGPNS